MTWRLGSIRLLPITIFALAGLLAMKSAQLVRAAVPVHDATPQVVNNNAGCHTGSAAARCGKAD